MEAKLEKLRQNDPSFTTVRLTLDTDEDCSRYGAAIHQNTVVDDLTVHRPLRAPALMKEEKSYGSLLQWIGTSTSLRRITFEGVGRIDGEKHFICHFLLAIAKNPGIQIVALRHMRYSLDKDALASLLCSARPKLKLSLNHVGFIHQVSTTPSTTEEDLDDVRAVVQDSLRGNTSLQSLEINDSDVHVYTTLLPPLSSCPAITEVSFNPSSSLEIERGGSMTFRARSVQPMADLLLSPPPNLERVRLIGFRNRRGDQGLETVLEHMLRLLREQHNTTRLAKITIEDCRFNRPATQLFLDLFQATAAANPGGIQSLEIVGPLYFTGPRFTDHTHTILGTLLRNNTTSLRNLDISRLRGVEFDVEFDSVLPALESNSAIECLNYGLLANDHQCNALARSLPFLEGVKELSIRFDNSGQYHRLTNKHLFEAIMGTTVLKKINIEQVPRAQFFSEAKMKKISFRVNCSRCVQEMLDPSSLSAEVVPRSLLPKLYVACRHQHYSSRGMTAIYRNLIRLEDQVGTADRNGRKRKHQDDDSGSHV